MVFSKNPEKANPHLVDDRNWLYHDTYIYIHIPINLSLSILILRCSGPESAIHHVLLSFSRRPFVTVFPDPAMTCGVPCQLMELSLADQCRWELDGVGWWGLGLGWEWQQLLGDRWPLKHRGWRKQHIAELNGSQAWMNLDEGNISM